MRYFRLDHFITSFVAIAVLVPALGSAWAQDFVARSAAGSDVRSAALELRVEKGKRELQEFNDTVVGQTSGESFYRKSLDLSVQTLVGMLEVTVGGQVAERLSGVWRLGGEFYEGHVRDQKLVDVPAADSHTISLDGIYVTTNRFSESDYTLDVSVKERGGAASALAQIAHRKVRNGSVSLYVGAVGGYRKQDWDITYSARFNRVGHPLFGALATHYIHESLAVGYGGFRAQIDGAIDLTNGLAMQLGLTADVYMQHAVLSGTDCFSGAFSGAVCDGGHHTRRNGVHFGKADARKENVGAALKLSAGLRKSFRIAGHEAALFAGGYIEARINDAAIDNPTFSDQRAASIKYDNVAGYGWTAGGTLRF